jgi:uncharacterized membrane protein
MPVSRSTRLTLFVVGFFLIFAGVILIVVSSFVSDYGLSTSVIIIVGPIPIIIGSGSYSLVAVFMAAVLTIVSMVLFFLEGHRKKQTV